MIGRATVSFRPACMLGVVCATALAAALAFASPAAAECLNETLRRESNPNPTTGKPYSAGLPDCRAYEMVSPLNKQGRAAERISALGSGGIPVAPGGDTAAWGSYGAFSNPENVLIINMP